MKGHSFTLLRSVTAKLLVGSLAMVLMIISLGAFALGSLTDATDVVTDTFDRPLMAINFARAASQKFAALEIETLRFQVNDSAVKVDLERFDAIAQDFRDDLDVARSRSISERADSVFAEVDADFLLWSQAQRAWLEQSLTRSSQISSLPHQESEREMRITENLDIIVELQTNESFRNREAAISKMESIRNISKFAAIFALFVAVSLSVWIAWTIIRPLKSAAYAATQISKGRLDINIPTNGRDETGLLLRAMKDMQDNIRLRMEREQDLRSLAQDRLTDSLENSKDAVLLTDVKGKIIVANPDVKALFAGVTKSKTLIGLQAKEFLDSDGIPYEVDNRDGDRDFKLPDGRWFRVNASNTTEGGKLFIWSEMTEIRQNAANLREARDAAEAASRAKTLFLAAMSHELNTPLNAIIGLADIIAYKVRNGDDQQNKEMADMMDMIVKSGEHMNQIVRDVLEIASDDKSTSELLFEPVELSSIVESCLKQRAEKAREAKVRLLLEPISSPINVHGDETDLRLLIEKLLDNAINFNRPGGSAKVQLQKMENGTIRLNVIDNGIGIAAKDLSRIFEPFQQVSQGYTRSVDGTGLGLAVASRIANRHNTRIQVQSRLGSGSVFTVIFDSSEKHELTNTFEATLTKKRNAA